MGANPNAVAGDLRPGAALTVPLPFDVVPTDIAYSSALINYCVQGLAARYPALAAGELGKSVLGAPLWYLRLGTGENRVLYNAAHHANEWITVPLLLKFTEALCRAEAAGENVFGQSVREMLKRSTLWLVPAVNPDGVDLVTGALTGGAAYDYARAIAARYPQFSFPDGWKANIRGIDLNLQYPAGWEQAKANKEALGIVSPAPADYVGPAPLTAPESRAMLPLFGAISDRCRSPRGRRTPFILIGTLVAAVALVGLSFVDNAQLSRISDVSTIDDPAALTTIYETESDARLLTPSGESFVLSEKYTEAQFTAIRSQITENGKATTNPEYTDFVVPARQACAWQTTAESPVTLIFFIGLLLIVLVSMPTAMGKKKRRSFRQMTPCVRSYFSSVSSIII